MYKYDRGDQVRLGNQISNLENQINLHCISRVETDKNATGMLDASQLLCGFHKTSCATHGTVNHAIAQIKVAAFVYTVCILV